MFTLLLKDPNSQPKHYIKSTLLLHKKKSGNLKKNYYLELMMIIINIWNFLLINIQEFKKLIIPRVFL